jgi:hypothetical protein
MTLRGAIFRFLFVEFVELLFEHYMIEKKKKKKKKKSL